MLGLGIFELIIFSGIALVVIGPENIPNYKQVMRTLREWLDHLDKYK